MYASALGGVERSCVGYTGPGKRPTRQSLLIDSPGLPRSDRGSPRTPHAPPTSSPQILQGNHISMYTSNTEIQQFRDRTSDVT